MAMFTGSCRNRSGESVTGDCVIISVKNILNRESEKSGLKIHM